MGLQRRDELKRGVTHLSALHRRLVDLLIGVQVASAEEQPAQELRRLAAELTLQLRILFFDQEMIMEGAGYPGLESHRRLHAAFTDGILRTQSGLRILRGSQFAELLKYERAWIARHLDEEDGAFAMWLEEKTAAEGEGVLQETAERSSVPRNLSA